MRKRKETIKLAEKEEELIRAIRNYQRSYPNGYPQLLYYIQQLVDEQTFPKQTPSLPREGRA